MQQDVKTNKTLSWYVYFTLVMIFISPILLYELLGIATGMVTRGEYMEVLKQPLNLVVFLLAIAVSVFACLFLKKLVANYNNNEVSVADANRKFRIFANINIITALILGILQGLVNCVAILKGAVEFSAFEGETPFVAVFCYSLAVVFCFSLLLVPFIIDSVNAIDRFDWLYAIMGLGLLVVVLILAETKFGAKNWVKINNTSIQPSEFVKIIFVFCIASMLSKAKKLSQIIYISLLAGAHVIVLVLEKDLGAALLFFVTYFVMLYIARKNGLYIVLGSVMGILAAIVAYKIPHFSHVRVRVMAWQNPWDTAAGAGYQVAQSLFAIGTGGWFGLGLTKGLPYKVPVRESDFIFSVVCEELGVIIGIMIILICLSNYIMFINIAMQIRNLFYKLIAVGLSTMYIFQVLLTIGGAVKFIPSTGVTLPFVSYGGSSILSSLIVFSVIQGLYVRKASS